MSDNLDPTKFHILSDKQKIHILLIIVIILMFFIPTFGFWYYNYAINRPSQTDKELTFEIIKGQSVMEVSENLHKLQALNSKFLFNLYAVVSDLDKNIQAGIYTIPAGTSIKDLVQKFQHGTLDKSITFLEGWRVEEFAIKASEQYENVNFVDFVNEAKNLEGFLFPDTYIFNSSITSDQIVEHLNNVFKQKTKDLLSQEFLVKSDLTPMQVMIFASILERETSNLSDRHIVAGILIKRFKEGMLVGADATTQYSVANLKYPCNTQKLNCTKDIDYSNSDWWKKDLSIDDLNINDSYNTRKNLGLPPTPIANPSLSSIKSVINYVESDYYYYLNDLSGKTHYATNLIQHQENIEKYLSY